MLFISTVLYQQLNIDFMQILFVNVLEIKSIIKIVVNYLLTILCIIFIISTTIAYIYVIISQFVLNQKNWTIITQYILFEYRSFIYLVKLAVEFLKNILTLNNITIVDSKKYSVVVLPNNSITDSITFRLLASTAVL